MRLFSVSQWMLPEPNDLAVCAESIHSSVPLITQTTGTADRCRRCIYITTPSWGALSHSQ